MDLPNQVNCEVEDVQEIQEVRQPMTTSHPQPKIPEPQKSQISIPTIDNVKSLIEVQPGLYKDMHAILLEIYGSELLIIGRQFRVQNIIQKHFIAMRNDLHKEMRIAVEEATGRTPWWRKVFCR